MFVTWLTCLCILIFSYPDQMHYATNRQDQVFNIKALDVILSTIIVYFVIQLLSEPNKQNVACLFKRQLLLILSRKQN